MNQLLIGRIRPFHGEIKVQGWQFSVARKVCIDGRFLSMVEKILGDWSGYNSFKRSYQIFNLFFAIAGYI